MRFLSYEHPEGFGAPDCGAAPSLYAHGKLEHLLFNDLLGQTNWASMLPGVWKVTVEDEQGIVRRCLAFVWHCGHTTKGLVVLPDDQDAVRQGIAYFTEKPTLI